MPGAESGEVGRTGNNPCQSYGILAECNLRRFTHIALYYLWACSIDGMPGMYEIDFRFFDSR